MTHHFPHNAPAYPTPNYDTIEKLRHPLMVTTVQPDPSALRAIGEALSYLMQCEAARQTHESLRIQYQMSQKHDMEKLEQFVRGLIRQMIEEEMPRTSP
jgi:uncharacterized membrane-anchored protein YjiN (DUF445 family)